MTATTKPPPARPLIRAGSVVLICGGDRAFHGWEPADPADIGARATGPWLRCRWCGWWSRPEGYRP